MSKTVAGFLQCREYHRSHSSEPGMLMPRGQIIRPRPRPRPWPSWYLDLMASGLGLVEIGLVASKVYSIYDIN